MRKWVGLVLAIRACVRGLIGNVVVLKRNNTQKKNKEGVNGWLVIVMFHQRSGEREKVGGLVYYSNTTTTQICWLGVCQYNPQTLHKYSGVFCRYITYLCALVLTYTEPENGITLERFVLECPLSVGLFCIMQPRGDTQLLVNPLTLTKGW